MIEHKIGVSRRSSLLHLATKSVAGPCLGYWPMSGPASRVFPVLNRAATVLPRLGGTVHKTIDARTWRGEIVTPYDGPSSRGVVLYLHGGAFLMCGLATHRRVVERLSLQTGMTVLSVDYRQLPHAKLEQSIDDCVEAYRWLLRKGHQPRDIVIAGDSAGGHLTFATALRLKDSGEQMPAGLVGMSPWVDFDHQGKRSHHNARRDAYIPARRMGKLARLIVGTSIDDCHSPVNADLRGLPPTLILCGDAEVLRVDAELLTERLEQADVPVRLQVWEDQIHAFPVMGHLTPESRSALESITDFITERVDAGSARRGLRVLRRRSVVA